MKYGRFLAMIATSTVVMFGLMYLNTYLPSHAFWSETRAYMAIVMGATMAVVMLAFMLGMYTNRALNAAIFAGSVIVFAGALWLVRSQVTVQDQSFMRAMIPHHSIAIMTSTRSQISDPRVRQLADGIIYAQDKEIAEMRWLIADIDANGDGEAAAAPAPATLKSAEAALSSEVLSHVDPEFLTEEEIATAFPDGPECRFAYTGRSPSVFVTGTDDEGPAALVKISGDLVRLPATQQGDGAATFASEPLTATIGAGDDELHDLVVAAGEGYRAGFRGLYSCGS